MWYADHGTIEHCLKGVHNFLDLRWRDVLPAADNEFLQTTRDSEETVLVALGEIAGMIPAITQRVARLLRLIVIAGHHVRPTYDQFPFLARLAISAVRWINDAHSKTWQRQPARAENAPAGRPVHSHHGRRLGYAVAVEQGHVEMLFEFTVKRRR